MFHKLTEFDRINQDWNKPENSKLYKTKLKKVKRPNFRK